MWVSYPWSNHRGNVAKVMYGMKWIIWESIMSFYKAGYYKISCCKRSGRATNVCIELRRLLAAGFLLLCGSGFFTTAVAATGAEERTTIKPGTLSVIQVLQNVIENYPSLQTTALQVEKAGQQTARIMSQLAWQVNANAGVSNEAALFGGGVLQYQAGAGLSKRLQSGDSVSIQGSLRREDYDNPFGPNMANPAPLRRGLR